MKVQRNMWAEAWLQSINAYKFVALVVFGELFAEAMDITESGVSFVLWSFLAYVVHARVLLPPGNNADTNGFRMIGFTMRSFGIAFLMLIASLVPMFTLAAVLGTEQSGMLFVYGLVGLAILGLPVFVLLGTILPAFVADRARGVGVAVKRGKKQFGWIAGRLIIGPGLVLALSLALWILLLIPVDYDDEFWNAEGGFQPLAVFAMFVCFTVQAYATSLTAVILSRAFLRAEGMPEAAPA